MKSIFNEIKTITLALLISCFSVMFILACSGNSTPAKFYDVSIDDGINDVVTVKVEDGTLIKDIPNFQTVLEVEGRNFEGWKVDGAVVDVEKYTITKNITISAYWTITITFDPNGGEFSDGTSESKTVKIDVDSIVTIPQVSKADKENIKYTFIGWTETKFEDDAQDVTLFDCGNGFNKNITLYAYYGSVEYFTVTFKNCKSSFTKTVQSGTKLPEISSSQEAYINSNAYFLYWSESEENENEAIKNKFDVENDVVTKDMTLYGIYTPKLYGGIINTLSNGLLKISMTSKDIYLLKDGTPAGIVISYRNGDIIQPTLISVSGSYVTYEFPKVAEYGTHWVKVDNGKENTSSCFVIYEPKAVEDLIAIVDDTYVKLTWKKIDGFGSYSVEVKNGDTVVTTKNKCTNSAEFYLENDIEYTFIVKTDGTDKSASIKATPKITKKTSDYLLVMYLDGDNDLNDHIFMDMNEVEYGLYKIRNSDGSPKSDYASVNVVALWDGWNIRNDKMEDKEGAMIGKSSSNIYELGTDSSASITSQTSSGCVLSSKTKNLSHTAAWIKDSEGNQEVDMSDKQTLVNFLTWVKERYESDHIILQFSNHGAGPRALNPVLKTSDGKEFYNPNPNLRRAMCADYSTGIDSILLTKDIPWALGQAGFSKDNVDLIVEDVCLGASIEEAYELRNSSKYLLVSPNNVPAMGLDYTKFITNFTIAKLEKENGGIIDIGTNIISDYKNYYSLSYEEWVKLINDNGGYSTDLDASLLNTNRATLTLVDLDKIESVRNSMETLAAKIIETSNFELEDTEFVYDNDLEFIIPKKNSEEPLFSAHEFSTPRVRDFLKSAYTIPVYPVEQNIPHIYYSGTYSWLFDCADLMDLFIRFDDVFLEIGIAELCKEVLYNLSQTVISSWADGFVKSRTGSSQLFGNYTIGCFYHIENNKPSSSGVYNINGGYGLTVSGEAYAGEYYAGLWYQEHGARPPFYDKDLEFGKNSNWNELLSLLFGEYIQ